MYQIDTEKNDLVKLEPRQFQELGFRERDHLQEWIEKNPEALDPDILIIQKEYDGFNDTKERLDLLAIDKSGGLVVIENKLDDSGRNVIWQALKYASYCSTLTTSQIIKIYQEYLDKQGNGEHAKDALLEFLELDNEDQLLLNDVDQRMIFVANNFRKEVTSTVLWLLNHDINIQCFRATPYTRGEDMFLQIEQIIPLPETEEFVIDAREKEKADKSISRAKTERDAKLIEFWALLKKELNARQCNLLANVTPRGTSEMGSWLGNGKFSCCVGTDAIRVELLFRKDLDKKYFDSMFDQKNDIESKYKKEIIWERLDGMQRSRIKHEIPFIELTTEHDSFYDKDAWDIWIDWYAKNVIEFYDSLLPFWNKVKG